MQVLWAPAHSGAMGNDMADQFARESREPREAEGLGEVREGRRAARGRLRLVVFKICTGICTGFLSFLCLSFTFSLVGVAVLERRRRLGRPGVTQRVGDRIRVS